jgi:hypothetical protein
VGLVVAAVVMVVMDLAMLILRMATLMMGRTISKTLDHLMDTRNQAIHNIRLARLQELSRYPWVTAIPHLGLFLLNGYQELGLLQA